LRLGGRRIQDLLGFPAGGVLAMASPRSAGGDEAIWMKLREAGFDEDAVRRRDKAALIGYISRLESEVNLIATRRPSGAVFWFIALLAW
jgi:hypothetical protein